MFKNNKKLIYAIFTLIIATILTYLTFVIKPVNFWVEMSLSVFCLFIMALFFKRDLLSTGKITLRHVIIGVFSAFGLYVVFFIGNIVSGHLLPFSGTQISLIYGNKAQSSLALIGFLIFFIIGPFEEIYWRGFIQNTFAEKFGENKGYVISTLLYAGVHIVTGNFMLVVAALACGIYWGWIYKKEKSLVPVIISHAVWDLMIFVLLPLM